MKTKSATSSAFTMVEVLIAVTILSILLVAIATAFNASAMNYKENANIAEAMNSARQALDRMTATMRAGDWVCQSGATISCSTRFLHQNDLALRQGHNGEEVTFVYDSTNKRLNQVSLFWPSYAPPGITHKLCDNVIDVKFDKAQVYTRTDSETAGNPPITCVKNVVISLKVQVGDEVRTVSSGVVVRRAM